MTESLEEYKQKIRSCSEPDLHGILRAIDKEKYPDRHRAVLNELELRRNPQAFIPDVPVAPSALNACQAHKNEIKRICEVCKKGLCQDCGATALEYKIYCDHCVKSVEPEEPEEDLNAMPVYAGFWIRLVAMAIDLVLIALATYLGMILVATITQTPVPIEAQLFTAPEKDRVYIGFNLNLTALVVIFATWLYTAIMESSGWQGTWGKVLVGIKVTSLENHRISFARATGRFFSKSISAVLLFFGFVIIAFTQKKQALHDMMAGCLVVRRPG